MPPQDQQPVQPGQNPPTGQPSEPTASYDFILNPHAPPKKPLLPGADSMAKRIGFVIGGLILLLILFSIFNGLLAGKPKLDSMVTVAQDQQEMIHIATNATLQPDLSDTNKNLVATTQLSLSSSQSQILAYFANNKFKVSTKTLGLAISGSTDQQLSNAETAGTFNQALQDTMKTQLDKYVGDLKQSYSQITGPKARTLLSSDYNQAQLLISELSTSGSSGT